MVRLLFAFFVLTLFSTSISGADKPANGGILNGPLMKRAKRTPSDPLKSLKLAIDDLIATNGDAYPGGKAYLEQLAKLKSAEDPKFKELKREALMANPLLDFDKLVFIKRKGTGMPSNWQGNSSLRSRGKNLVNELLTMSIKTGKTQPLYKPAKKIYVGQFDLHYDAGKMLFSSVAQNGSWAIFEIKLDTATGALVKDSLRQVSPDMGKDIDNYDPVYLPSGKIMFVSSSGYTGVPCVGGKDYVGNLHVMDDDGSNVRRLTFEQDNDWNPVVMADGKVMYLRWEYTDSAHYFSRVMMSMNPDGTDQRGYYGSNSYWPNSMFFPQPVPGSRSKFVAIVGSHHGARRSGALVLFDAAKGRHETAGALQIIGERGYPVEPLVLDNLSRAYKPHYLTPYPLNDKYFLASIARGKGAWALCLVDVFDNQVILKEEKGWSLIEPVPFRKRPTPPVIPSKVRPNTKEATLWISDMHFGPGLRELPKGAAKSLRIYRYEYAPRRSGGHYAMGMEAGWDAKSVLGTVPLEADGSVMVKIPANTPLSVQPLDEEGKALQQMRSWLVAMPGEVLSCVGCHETPDATPPAKVSLAARKAPRTLTEFFGKARGFSFTREVQPVIDRNCTACHSPEGQKKPEVAKLIKNSNRRYSTGKQTGKLYKEAGIPDLSTPGNAHGNLHPFVRRNGPEGDYHLLTPMEFHADTSPLFQMLAKGHHNVKLDNESWARLITWADLNAPFHGTWTEATRGRNKNIEKRLELRKEYAEVDFDPEAIVNPYKKSGETVMPKPVAEPAAAPTVDGWPIAKQDAVAKKGSSKPMMLDLGDGVKMELMPIPKGSFAMGSNDESPLEHPIHKVDISKSFWMGSTEVTLAQYRQFDPDYLNGVYDMHYKDQVKRGYYMNDLRFPVIRITWEKANAFCEWLSAKTGKTVKLPTEQQWEWACRGGADTPFWYGGLDTDFSTFANLGDVSKKQLAVKGVNPKPIKKPPPHLDYELKDPRFNDKALHLSPVGLYKPNVWGLHDMHGNVAEWTASAFKAYGTTDRDQAEKRVVRGGSWDDVPARSTSSFRLGYKTWQPVYNVGFRVIVE